MDLYPEGPSPSLSPATLHRDNENVIIALSLPGDDGSVKTASMLKGSCGTCLAARGRESNYHSLHRVSNGMRWGQPFKRHKQ